MKNFGSRWLFVAGLVGALGSMNCGGGDEETGTGGTGGTAAGGRGGSSGKGGASAGHGGSAAGTGGTAVAGSGGSAGTGGTAVAGSGGSAGTGGMTDGGVPSGLPCTGLSTFDTAGTDGYGLNTFMPSGQQNLANAVDGGSVATLTFSSTDGNPTAGSLHSDAPFSDYNQFIQVQKDFATTALKDWTGLKLHVRVKVASGLNQSASNPAGIQPFVNSYAAGVDGGSASYNFLGGYSSLKTGNGWNEYTLTLAASGSFDPSKIVSVGVQIQTGNGAMGDGGVNPTKPIAASIFIDSVWLSKADDTCPSTGAGGAGGSATGGSGGGSAGAGGSAAGAGGHAGAATGGSGGGSAGAGGSAAGAGGHAGAATGGSGGAAAGAGGSAAGAGGSAAGAGGSAAGSGGSAAGAGGSAAGAGGSAAGGAAGA